MAVEGKSWGNQNTTFHILVDMNVKKNEHMNIGTSCHSSLPYKFGDMPYARLKFSPIGHAREKVMGSPKLSGFMV